MGTGFNFAARSMTLAKPTVSSVLSNIGASFGIGVGTKGAVIAIGSRLVFGGESAAYTYATGGINKNGEEAGVLDDFAKGALPEYEFGSRIAEHGISGIQPTDALLLLYFVNIKTDPPGTFRDANGTLRNARNPNGKPPAGSYAKDPRKASNGKPFEDRPTHKSDFAEKVFESGKKNGKVYDSFDNEIIWKPGQQRKGVWDAAHKYGYEYRHLTKALAEGRITEAQFLEYYHNPKYYYPENPSYNRSHRGESSKSLYDFDKK